MRFGELGIRGIGADVCPVKADVSPKLQKRKSGKKDERVLDLTGSPLQVAHTVFIGSYVFGALGGSIFYPDFFKIITGYPYSQ